MQDILITHKGNYLKEGSVFSCGNQTHLLHSDDSFEATIEIIPKGTVGCLYCFPEEDFEFNFILEGEMEICGRDEKLRLGVGDTFTYYKLSRNYMFRAIYDTKMLTTRKTPCYNAFEESVDHLNEVLIQLQKTDNDTHLHCERVKALSMGIAYFLKYDQRRLLDLFYAAKFHDVGKAKIPIEILTKPGRLNEEEYEIMKKHILYTYEMIREYYGESVAEIAYGHHEWLNGKGYPRGLQGDEISLASRIISVADAYDAMSVTRPYRKALSMEDALTELRRSAGSQFDGSVIDALACYLEEKNG